jgi:hypothetical protein
MHMANGATTTALSPAQAQQKAAQINAAARAAVLSTAVEMTQPIQVTTFNPAQTNPLLIIPRNVGLITSFLIVITGTIANNDSTNALTLTDFGLANLLSNLTFTDLNNNQRHQTTGWHLSFLNSVKHRKPYASGYALETDTMGGYGETYPILSTPATIAASGTANFRAVFEVPISYSRDDLRGAIFANVVNATMNLTLTINQKAFVATGTDSTSAVYKGTANAVFSTLTCTVYQNYYDQLPRNPDGTIILPTDDLSTVYELKNTSVTGIAANNEFGFQYPNFRDILSTFMVYNHDVSADAGRVAGTDVNYWALQSANFTNIWKKFPLDLSQDTRQILSCDLPKGAYYASSRRRPISSVQYGNMEIVLNALQAGSNAWLYVGLENFNRPNVVMGAGSIQS